MDGLGHVIHCSPYIVIPGEFLYFAVDFPTWQKKRRQKMLVGYYSTSRCQGTLNLSKDGILEVEVEF